MQDDLSSLIDILVKEMKLVNTNFQRLEVDISVARNVNNKLVNKIIQTYVLYRGNARQMPSIFVASILKWWKSLCQQKWIRGESLWRFQIYWCQ